MPPKNPVGVAHAIEEILVDDDKGLNLAKRAKQDSHKYEIQNTVDQMQEVYEKLMAV